MTSDRTEARLSALDARRILIVKPSALGDVVQALPVVTALRRRFPTARLTWLIQRELRDLVDGCPNLDDVMTCERRPTWSQVGRLFSELRQRQFDLVLDLQGLLRSAVMTLATGARWRIGLETAREGAAWATNLTIPNTGREIPAHARYWRVAEALGVGAVPRRFTMHVPIADHRRADHWLADLPRPLFGVQWGAKWETKRWPVEQFAVLLSQAGQTWGGSAVLVGGRDDAAECTRMAQLIAERNPSFPVLNLAGRTTIKQLAAVLTQTDIMVSNDSGPMHLAAELGVPTLGLFTCTSPHRSGPPGDRHEFVSTQVACAASYRKACPCPGDAKLACFRELDVARAWAGLSRLVERHGLAASVRRVA